MRWSHTLAVDSKPLHQVTFPKKRGELRGDRGIWTKSLAFAADAEELIFLYGFSMAVSPFDRPRSPERRIVESWGAAQ